MEKTKISFILSAVLKNIQDSHSKKSTNCITFLCLVMCCDVRFELISNKLRAWLPFVQEGKVLNLFAKIETYIEIVDCSGYNMLIVPFQKLYLFLSDFLTVKV